MVQKLRDVDAVIQVDVCKAFHILLRAPGIHIQAFFDHPESFLASCRIVIEFIQRIDQQAA